MGTQYLCSALAEARREDVDRYYVPDYPVYLAVSSDIPQEKLSTSPPVLSSRAEMEAAIAYTNALFPKILSHLAKRLSALHQYGSEIFWNRALGMHLAFLLEGLYAKFVLFQKTVDPSLHAFSLISLSPANFRLFDDLQEFLLGSDVGSEYIFARHMQTTAPNPCNGNQNVTTFQAVAKTPAEQYCPQHNVPFCKFSLVNFLRKLLSLRAPTVALLGTGIQAHDAYRLTCASFGKIQTLYIPAITLPPRERNTDLRQALFEGFPEEDDFCRVVKSIFIETFPTLYLENFADALEQAQSFWRKYPSLKYVINEYFIGYSLQSFLLAVAHQEQNILLYNNEHNGFFYAFLNSREDKAIEYVDKFLSAGWKSDNPKRIPLGRLFEWNDVSATLDIDALFFLPPIHRSVRMFASGDSFSGGANLAGLFTFFLVFFSRLSEKTILRMMYRPYPVNELTEAQLPPELTKYLLTMRQADPTIHGKDLLARSRLTIYTYTNSGYVEALHNNRPCIVFWDPNRCFLDKKHADFFDDLIEAGIVVQTPQAAAERLTQAIDDPQGWWRSASVQRGRKAFLDKNLGEPKALFDYLVRLSRT